MKAEFFTSRVQAATKKISNEEIEKKVFQLRSDFSKTKEVN